MVSANYAYSLAQDELGWKWKVYDESGEIVGSGRNEAQDAAESAIKRTISTVFSSEALCRGVEIKPTVDRPQPEIRPLTLGHGLNP
jgi:hypothetical protein